MALPYPRYAEPLIWETGTSDPRWLSSLQTQAYRACNPDTRSCTPAAFAAICYTGDCPSRSVLTSLRLAYCLSRISTWQGASPVLTLIFIRFSAIKVNGDNAVASTDATTGANSKTGGMKEELPSSAPTAITATDDNGGGQAPSPVARLCRCPGTTTAPKGGQKRGSLSAERPSLQYDSVLQHRAVPTTPPTAAAAREQQPARNAAQQNAALPFLPTYPSSSLHVSHAHSRRSRRRHADAQPSGRTLLHAQTTHTHTRTLLPACMYNKYVLPHLPTPKHETRV